MLQDANKVLLESSNGTSSGREVAEYD